MESDLFYDCVANESGDGSAPIQTVPRSRLEQLALDLVDDEERNVRERASEVEFLAGLGINVLDMSLQADTARLEVLPVMERMAQIRFNHLYDDSRHKRLTKAIIRELKQKYENFKKDKAT